MSSHIFVGKSTTTYFPLAHIKEDSYYYVVVSVDGVDVFSERYFYTYDSAYNAGERYLKENEEKDRERIKRNIELFGREYYFPKSESELERIKREKRICQQVENETAGELGCGIAIIFIVLMVICLLFMPYCDAP